MEWFSEEAWQLWRWSLVEQDIVKAKKLLKIAKKIESKYAKHHPRFSIDGGVTTIDNSGLRHRLQDIIDGIAR